MTIQKSHQQLQVLPKHASRRTSSIFHLQRAPLTVYVYTMPLPHYNVLYQVEIIVTVGLFNVW